MPTIPTRYRECYLPNRAFGLELETNEELTTPRGWTSCYDGSIEGKEYHSGPVLGQDGIDLVTSGCNSLSDGQEPVDESCGYHIHLNARDLTEAQVSQFCRFAHYYEDYYFLMVRRRRHAESYCQRLPSAFANMQDISGWLYGTTRTRSQSSEKYHNYRCLWVNTHSYFYRGSIEIRLHHGVTKAKKVLNWAEVMLKSLEYGALSNWEETKPQFWDMLASAGIRQSTREYYQRRIVAYHGEGYERVDSRAQLVRRENAPA